MNSRFTCMRNISFSGLKDHIGLTPSETPITLLYSTTYNMSLRRPRLLFERRKNTRGTRLASLHHAAFVRKKEDCLQSAFSLKSAEFLDNKHVETRSYPHGLRPLFLAGRRSRELLLSQ